MNTKKKILAIVLIIVVLLLGGASIYVATQLSTRQAVAPTAPESKPAAADCTSLTTQAACDAQAVPDCAWYSVGDCNKCATTGTPRVDVCPEWVGSDTCTATGSATAIACVPSGVVTCDPDCPTACGTDASTISTCTDSCGLATTKSCPATESCKEPVLEGVKKAFKNDTANTAGKYTLTAEMSTVSKSQIYVYSVNITNTSEATATGVTIKDSLKDVPSLSFMDTVSGCTWSAANVELTCNTTIKPKETKTFSFRVKAIDGIVNGDVISNTAKVTYTGGEPFDLTKDLTVSTVVGCNHSCTTDEECATGLTCDTTTNKCRLAACLTEVDCTCGVVSQSLPTATKTIAPTREATATVTAQPTPETLTDAGILDFPGIAAFGGGLLLAIVGILLAL